MELTKDNFRSAYENNKLMFVIFRADWCGPCQSFRPTYEKLAEEEKEFVFGTVDVDAEPEISNYFSIRSVPFVVVLREGVELYAEPGVLDSAQMKDLMQQAKTVDMDEVRKKIAAEEDKN